MSEYSTGLLHGLILSVITDVIANFVTILLAKRIFDKNKISSAFKSFKGLFKRK